MITHPLFLKNKNGITIQQLKAWLEALGEDKSNGKVWMATDDGRCSNEVAEVCVLNKDDVMFDRRRT